MFLSKISQYLPPCTLSSVQCSHLVLFAEKPSPIILSSPNTASGVYTKSYILTTRPCPLAPLDDPHELQTSPFFLSRKTCKIGCLVNTLFPLYVTGSEQQQKQLGKTTKLDMKFSNVWNVLTNYYYNNYYNNYERNA